MLLKVPKTGQAFSKSIERQIKYITLHIDTYKYTILEILNMKTITSTKFSKYICGLKN